MTETCTYKFRATATPSTRRPAASSALPASCAYQLRNAGGRVELLRDLDLQRPPAGPGRRLGPVGPGVVARPRHAQQPAHERDVVIVLLRADQRAALGYGCVRAKKAAAFFRNSFSIRSRRISSSISFTRARSTGVRSVVGSGFSRRQIFTQLPRVPSLIPKSRPTSAIGLPVSSTICTASALNCGLNFLRCSGMDASSQVRGRVQDRWYTPFTALGVSPGARAYYD